MSQSRSNEVIIVDDDPAVRDALSVIFSLEGFHVTSFGDGQSVDLKFLERARGGAGTSDRRH